MRRLLAARGAEITIVLRIGRLVVRGFEPDYGMAKAISKVVDVGQAEAAVEADQVRILGIARSKPGGLAGLNAAVGSAILASLTAMAAPGSRGPEPSRSTTRAIAAGVADPTQRSSGL